MKLTTCKKMCNECPFSKNSLRGWLGGFSIEETLNAQQFEQLFSCHKQREDDEEENSRKIVNGEINICRGFILSASLSCKLFGQNPSTGKELARLQVEVKASITDDEKEMVLRRWDFPKHHTL